MDQFIQWLMQQTGTTSPAALYQGLQSGKFSQIASQGAQMFGVNPNDAVSYIQQASQTGQFPQSQQGAAGGAPKTQAYAPGMSAQGANPNDPWSGQAVGGVNNGAIAAYQNATPAMQQYLTAQGLAPNIQTPTTVNSQNSGIQSYQQGQLAAQMGKQGYQLTQGPGGPGTSGVWTKIPGSGAGLPGGPPAAAPASNSAIPGVGSIPGLNNIGDIAAQTAAVHAQGAVSNLNQQAAASGNSDQLAYKDARLGRELAAGRASGTLDTVMKQAQIAQMFSQAAVQGAGINNFMAQVK